MNNVAGFRCVECGREHRIGETEYVCVSCGGNLDLVYDYGRVRALLTKASLTGDRNFTMWRYRALLPIEDSAAVPPLTVGWTPIYDSSKLAQRYGVRQLLIKDDGRNPTGSFKDRPSALAVVKAQEAEAAIITTASSGTREAHSPGYVRASGWSR